MNNGSPDNKMMTRWSTDACSERPVDREFKSHRPHILTILTRYRRVSTFIPTSSPPLRPRPPGAGRSPGTSASICRRRSRCRRSAPSQSHRSLLRGVRWTGRPELEHSKSASRSMRASWVISSRLRLRSITRPFLSGPGETMLRNRLLLYCPKETSTERVRSVDALQGASRRPR